MSAEKGQFEKHSARDKKNRAHHPDLKKHKYGDIHPETGMVFWGMQGKYERWHTPEDFKKRKAQQIEAGKIRRQNNIEKYRLKGRQGYHRYAEKRRAQACVYKQKHPERIKASQKKYKDKKYASLSKIEKFKLSIRGVIQLSFKRKKYRKKSKSTRILGCKMDAFMDYIQALFLDGMTWDNYGAYRRGGERKWQLDHIIPVDAAKTEEEVIALCHYRNFRPLWAIDNLKKKNKILPEFAHLVPVAV